MKSSEPVYLQCAQCGHVEYGDHLRVMERLRELKMLRRDAEPDGATVAELLRHAVLRFACVHCGAIGLDLTREDPLDASAWGEPVQCEVCQSAIPPERLDVFPDAKRCAGCQSKEERGDATESPDYCPRCGDVMRLRPRTGAGLASYRSYCPTCGK